MQKILNEALQNNQLDVTTAQQQKLIAYLELISKWNKVFNLTTILQPRDMVYLHIIDSLMVSPFVSGEHCLDVGSGAGLPGIPLAITNPEQNWTLLDKNNKKTRFMTQAVAELGLQNVQVIHSRCEDFKPQPKFDNILSRAYATLRIFTETTKHLLCKNGIFIAMKGKYPEDEIADLPDDIAMLNTQQINITGKDIDRHIICLKQLENKHSG